MPVRLPPIPSEELEHVEDSWLDDAYELKLARSGDDLAPIAGAAKPLLETVTTAAASPASQSASNGNPQNAAAVAMALAEASGPVAEGSQELPDLAPDATDEELLAYAKAHPAVRAALKVFRGKIVKVTRRGQ
jgi:hypothetical protein